MQQFHDTPGPRGLLRRAAYRSPFGVLVAMWDAVEILDRRIIAVSLPALP